MSVLLLSGGLDSAVCLRMCKPTVALTVNYGQAHVIEIDYAERLAREHDVEWLPMMIPILPKVNDLVFAGRNAVLIALAASVAQSRGLDAVIIGCNADDRAEFPDCRALFLHHMSAAIQGAYGVYLKSPLIEQDKRGVVRLAREYGIPIEQTWTCYRPRDGAPCGKCYACRSTQAALA